LTIDDDFESITFENSTTLRDACGKVLSGGGGDYTKIGVVAADEKVRADAKTFFTSYFLPENSLPSATYTEAERTLTFTADWPAPFNELPFLG